MIFTLLESRMTDDGRKINEILTFPGLKKTLVIPNLKSSLSIPTARNNALQNVLGSSLASLGGKNDLYLQTRKTLVLIEDIV